MLAHIHTLKFIRRLYIFKKRLHTFEYRAFSRCSTNVVFLGLSAVRFHPSKQILKNDFLLSPPEGANAPMSSTQVPWHLMNRFLSNLVSKAAENEELGLEMKSRIGLESSI